MENENTNKAITDEADPNWIIDIIDAGCEKSMPLEVKLAAIEHIKIYASFSRASAVEALLKDAGKDLPTMDDFNKRCDSLNGQFPDQIFRWMRTEASKLLASERGKHKDQMHDNMQYYMEYCKRHAYVTPQDWIEKHSPFKQENA